MIHAMPFLAAALTVREPAPASWPMRIWGWVCAAVLMAVWGSILVVLGGQAVSLILAYPWITQLSLPLLTTLLVIASAAPTPSLILHQGEKDTRTSGVAH